MKMHSAFVTVCLFTLLTSLASAQPAPAWPQERSDIAPSPRVTWGRLENGLRYAILPNRTPERLVSLRLLVLTGSLHERDDERGYAHYVEHMAFNGTRHFPAGELVKFLQRGGAAFGPHVNAVTSETRTLYKLDLPEATPASVADGLRVLRDFADGILFEKAEVERERGVLASEVASRRSVDFERVEAWRKFLFAGTLVPERHPVGTDAARKSATAAKLREFYDAGYRPEKMVLVIAGDCAVESVQAELRTQFASLTARGPARAETKVGALPVSQKSRAILHHAARDGVQIELISVRPRDDAADNEAKRQRALQLDLARSMVGRRLQRLTETRTGVISGFEVRHDEIAGCFQTERVIVAGNAKEWIALLAIAEQEMRRAVEQGFDPTELQTELENLRTRWRQDAATVETLATPGLAEGLAATIENGQVFTLGNERLPVALAKLGQVTAAECQAAWRAEWEHARLQLFVTASAQWLKVAPEKILAAYESSRATPVKAAEALTEVKFAYEDFGPAGAVVQRAHLEDLDVWQVKFANGVRLNLKRTAFERAKVQLRLRFGSGRVMEPKDQPGLGLWAGGLVVGGLKRHTNEEMRQAMRGHAVGLNMRASDDACEMSGAVAATELRRSLQVAAAYLVDPAWRTEEEPRVRGLLSNFRGNLQTTPDLVLLTSIAAFHSGGDTRLGMPTRAEIEKLSFPAVAAWLKPMLETSPLEVTLVGDLDVEAAIAEVAKTFGALPARAESATEAGERKLKFPRPPETRRYNYPAVAGRPTTLVFDWPVRDKLTTTDERRLRLLCAVLEDRLRVQIREEKGATYSPDASFVQSEVFPGLAFMRCRLDVQTKSAKRIAEQVATLATELGDKGCAEEELARARMQALAGAKQQLANNQFWVDRLDGSQARPVRLDELRTLERDYAAATTSEVNGLARRYLTEQNLFRFFIEPKTVK